MKIKNLKHPFILYAIVANFFPKPRDFCDRIFLFTSDPQKSLKLAHKEKD
jgi:hypothetical protein